MHKVDRRKRSSKEKALHHAFVRILMKMPVKDVKFSGNKVALTFFNFRISDNIVVKKEDHVAEWSRRRKEVFVDKKMNVKKMMKSFKALCVHEVIEKFLVERFGLRLDEEAHKVATQKEKEYLHFLDGNWRSHEILVYYDWKRMGKR